MWEEGSQVMEKKTAPRQSTGLTKSNIPCEKKIDFSPNKNSRSNRRQGNGHGYSQDFSNRRPTYQKPGSDLVKRPRSRGYTSDRQRKEVAESQSAEAGSALYHGSKKGNLNHLLNFRFADRENVVGSTNRLRGRRFRVTYNKERYLQANCQFVVKNTGDYSIQGTDPDALVNWDLVEQVRTFSHDKGTCPICLQVPYAGKITRCGHIYCWACILHYLSLDDKSWRKCPICYESIHKSDLRSVKVIERKALAVGDIITFQLMKRTKGSTYTVPVTTWEEREGKPQNIDDKENTEYAKVLVASADQIQTSVIQKEFTELQDHLASAEPSEVCFIDSALAYLAEREAALKITSQTDQDLAQMLTHLSESGESHILTSTSSQHESSTDGSQETEVASAASPSKAENLPLARDVSFDGSKIKKIYADAFDDLHDDESASSVFSEEMSDQDEVDEALQNPDMLSRAPKPDASDPIPVSDHICRSLDVEETLVIQKSLPVCGLEGGDIMTPDEAVEQLQLPGDGEVDAKSFHRRGGNPPKDAFYFYQAADGQHIYLHSLNARCIISQYGSLENGPTTVSGRILDKEVTFMTENIRKRLRYLSHLPLTCEFQVVEVELTPPVVSQQTLKLFADEIKKRAKRRQQKCWEDKRQERKNQIQEKMSYGIYPEVKLALDSPVHFPAPVAVTEERLHHASISDASLSSHTETYPTELNAHAAEFVPKMIKCETTEGDNKPSTFSFAAALKKAKQPVHTQDNRITSHSVSSSSSVIKPLMQRSKDSDESDNEDRVPVPRYQASFSDAIQSALESLNTEENASTEGKSLGKKKKKMKTLLFSTSMMRK